MDLRAENLVPMKSILRRRDGQKAVFINYLEDGQVRVCPEQNGSYIVENDGSAGLREKDIVAVARPRELRVGDEVEITGFVIALHVSSRATGIAGQVDQAKFVSGYRATLLAPCSLSNAQGADAWCFRANDLHGQSWSYSVERKNIKFIRRPGQ